MQQILVIPEFGVSTEEVEVLEWLKETGARVERGEPILHVETDKATVEVESTHEGILLEQLCSVGETLAVGRPYAAVGEPEDPAGDPEAPAPPVSQTPPVAEPQEVGEQVGAVEGVVPASSPIRATPRARRLARDLGLDLGEITGSGPEGRVRDTDVTAVLAARERAGAEAPGAVAPTVASDQPASAAPADPSSVLEDLTPVQRVAVRRLVRQQQETPQFHLDATVEADALLDLLATVNDGRESRYSVTDVLLRAAAVALVDVPHANVRWADGRREVLATTHLSLAVAADGDLLVPVLRDVARKPLHEVRAARVEATRAARSRTLGPGDQVGGSLTVSNLGMYQVDGVFPVLNPPEAMILGVGRVRRPSGGGPALVKLVLGADHRVLNGAAVAEYLSRLVELVERPVDALL